MPSLQELQVPLAVPVEVVQERRQQLMPHLPVTVVLRGRRGRGGLRQVWVCYPQVVFVSPLCVAEGYLWSCLVGH